MRTVKRMFLEKDALGAFGICFESLCGGIAGIFEAIFGGLARWCGK